MCGYLRRQAGLVPWRESSSSGLGIRQFLYYPADQGGETTVGLAASLAVYRGEESGYTCRCSLLLLVLREQIAHVYAKCPGNLTQCFQVDRLRFVVPVAVQERHGDPCLHLKLRAVQVLPLRNIFDLQPCHDEALLLLNITMSTYLYEE